MNVLVIGYYKNNGKSRIKYYIKYKTNVHTQNIVKDIYHNRKHFYLFMKNIYGEMKKMVVNDITQKIGEFLKDSNINLSDLSRKAGIPYSLLYASVWDKNRKRDLRANEFMSICVVLDLNPMDFAGDPDEKEG